MDPREFLKKKRRTAKANPLFLVLVVRSKAKSFKLAIYRKHIEFAGGEIMWGARGVKLSGAPCITPFIRIAVIEYGVAVIEYGIAVIEYGIAVIEYGIAVI